MPRILFRAQLGDQQEVGPGLWTATRTSPGRGGSRSSLVELGRNGRAGCGVPSEDGMTCRSSA